MTDIIKQRLIGALLLLTVIVLLAAFLVNSASQGDAEKNISEPPKAPSFISSIEPMPVEKVDVEQEVLLDPHKLEMTENNLTANIEVADTMPAPTTNITVEQSWIIQLAGFGVKENAQAFNEKVKALGFNSKIEQKELIYRVRIGPESNKQHVDKIVIDIAKKLEIKAQILSVK